MKKSMDKHMVRFLIGMIACFWVLFAHAEPGQEPLPADQAFRLSVEYNQPGLLILHWQLAKDYFLYKNKLLIQTTPSSSVQIGALVWPDGVIKQDSLHGAYQAYVGQLIIPVPLISHATGKLELEIHYQGCSESGFCYPPIHQLLALDLANIAPPADVTSQLVIINKKASRPPEIVSKQTNVQSIFTDRSFFFILLSFMGLGLLLAFTPCVLPMIPILSGIIVGHGKQLGIRKTFLLSLSYVIGMAMTYAVAGVMVAMVGSSIQAQLQRPWVIALFSGFFVLLALSLFGLYEFQLPSHWQRRITAWSNRQKGGSYFSVFLMGSISSLIVSPCVSPPLIGVLSFIADSGNLWLGGLALLALGIGMGLPLLAIGLSAGHILPRAGAWMGTIEKLMGVTMLAFAIWILSRIIPGYVTLFLWAVLSIMTAVFLGLFGMVQNDFQRICRVVALVLLIYGIILMIGAALGNDDPLHPWKNRVMLLSDHSVTVNDQKNLFLKAQSMRELDELLSKATSERKIVLLDFYADWCEACVKMDKDLFSLQTIQLLLSDAVLIRVDVTNNDEFSQAVQKRFHVVAPPTMLFFKQDGKEIITNRLVGSVKEAELIAEIKQVRGY